jgi:hypothetical protein
MPIVDIIFSDSLYLIMPGLCYRFENNILTKVCSITSTTGDVSIFIQKEFLYCMEQSGLYRVWVSNLLDGRVHERRLKRCSAARMDILPLSQNVAYGFT